jgi:cell division protein FtsQ
VWNDAWALTLVTRLILAATLVFSVYTTARGLAETYLPIREVRVSGAQRPETRAALARIIPQLRGSLFSMDLGATRQAFEAIPWVRRAQISRVWPARLRIYLAEHVPAAAWNGTSVLNVQGEVFPVKPWTGLPDFHAPEGMESEVARQYGAYAGVLADSGLRIATLRVDERHAWRLTLRRDDGGTLGLDLGRERMAERLRRFLDFYPLVAAHSGPIRRVDMRYPNGFAVEAGPATESKT